jgi:acetoin utilization deacetylase AcuC-like enzyme
MHVFYSPVCLGYWQHGHPEKPERIKNTYELLDRSNKFNFHEVDKCSEKDLLDVHSQDLIESVKQEKFFDPDSPALPLIFDHALLSVGSAIKAMEFSLKNNKNTFSLCRPPGHHAGKNFLGGFCYFNSIAIAVEKALKHLDKIAILDIDGHHGNGTQDIFFGRNDVLFISLHERGSFPMSGFVSEKNCINYPLPPGCREKEYMIFLEKALEKVEDFSADALAVSAGFDTYKNDPLLTMNLEIDSYRKIALAINELDIPVFSILEGGYSASLPECIMEFLLGMRN